MPTAIGTYATTSLVKARLFAAGVTDTADDTLIGTICDQINMYIEGPQGTGRVLAPISSATYLLDGNGTRGLYFPKGIRAITELKIGDFTGDTLDTITATDYVIRPAAHDRATGWPATWVILTDRPTSGHWVFADGYDTVSMTCTAGWAAMPDDVIDVALTAAVRSWHARQSGQADLVGNDETGQPLVSRFFSARDLGTLRAYRKVDGPG